MKPYESRGQEQPIPIALREPQFVYIQQRYLGAVHMNRAALLTLIVLVAATQAANAVKIITPTIDSCRAYVTAIDTANANNASLSGWAVGFLDGVAQGAGIDFLRNYEGASLTGRLYLSCRDQPDKQLSLAAEELARTMITEQGLMPTRQ
jgi:hypothetical protein